MNIFELLWSCHIVYEGCQPVYEKVAIHWVDMKKSCDKILFAVLCLFGYKLLHRSHRC